MTARGASDAPAQLVLDLPQRAALGAEDFLVSASNETAVALIDAWPGWPARAVALVGPTGAGKTHLCHVWMLRSGGVRVAGSELNEDAVAELESRHALAVEDIDRGIRDERVLFHLLNLAREKGYAIVLTSRDAPGDLDVVLPDLRSRLRGAPVVRIEGPDTALVMGVMVKLFADRQLLVEPHVISYLALHCDRSMEAVNAIVDACDRLALARQRKLTRAIAAEALNSLGLTGFD